MHHPISNLLLIGAILSGHTFLLTNAYRIGDAVGILLRTHTPTNGSATLEAYRHQLPRFGVSTKTRFDVSSLLNPDDMRLSEDVAKPQRPKNYPDRTTKDALSNEHLRLSLAFDEGFHHIPWLDVYNPSRHNERVLQKLVITIVYSGSDGSIHAVHRETKYQDSPISKGDGRRISSSSMPKSFTVEYIWVNEVDVDVQGGLLALFVAVLIASLCGMIGACTSSADEDGVGKERRYKEKSSSSSLGGGNSEGFAKRL